MSVDPTNAELPDAGPVAELLEKVDTSIVEKRDDLTLEIP